MSSQHSVLEVGFVVSPPWGVGGKVMTWIGLITGPHILGYSDSSKRARDSRQTSENLSLRFSKLELKGRYLSFRVPKLGGCKSGAVSCHVPQCMEKAQWQQQKRKPTPRPGRVCWLSPSIHSLPLLFTPRISFLRLLAAQLDTKFTASLAAKHGHVTRWEPGCLMTSWSPATFLPWTPCLLLHR